MLHYKILFNGKGTFPKNIVNQSTTSTPTELIESDPNITKQIQRIVVFYNDGTFDEFKK